MASKIQLDDELEQMVKDTARQMKVSRSEVVRRSIREFCRKYLAETDVYPWELMKDLVGGFHSGRGDLARRSRHYVKEIIFAKDAERRRRAG